MAETQPADTSDLDADLASLLDRLRRGDESAAKEVFSRYAAKLLALSRAHLSRLVQSKVDADDVLQSVLRSFFQRQRQGSMEIANWDGLWGMLVRITLRKCGRNVERYTTARRDVRREQFDSPDANQALAAWAAVAREPTPEDVCTLRDSVEAVMRRLDATARSVLELRLQGFGVREIAEKMEFTERTVFRKIDLIKDQMALLMGS